VSQAHVTPWVEHIDIAQHVSPHLIDFIAEQHACCVDAVGRRAPESRLRFTRFCAKHLVLVLVPTVVRTPNHLALTTGLYAHTVAYTSNITLSQLPIVLASIKALDKSVARSL
jgi:hypothetical protein